MVAIIDYGVGNLFSIQCSLRYLGIESAVTRDAGVIAAASHIILPGVGAFGDAAEKLRRSGLGGAVLEQAGNGKPLLGICLGMQLLFEKSFEYGEHGGLGLLPGAVVPLRGAVGDDALKIPHMGWNSLSDAFLGVKQGDYVYYVHSFFVPAGEHTRAWSVYGDARVSGIVTRGNIYGTQFHPEKSGEVGLRLLSAFCNV